MSRINDKMKIDKILLLMILNGIEQFQYIQNNLSKSSRIKSTNICRNLSLFSKFNDTFFELFREALKNQREKRQFDAGQTIDEP